MRGKACIQTQILQPPKSVLASHVCCLPNPSFPGPTLGNAAGGVPWQAPPRPAMLSHRPRTVWDQNLVLDSKSSCPLLARLRVPSSLVFSKGVEKMPVWVLRHKPYPKKRRPRKGNGTPLQYSCLENPTDGGAWWAAVHGVAKGRTRLSAFTCTFHFHGGEGNGNPLQCSCLETPRDRGA